MSEAPPLKIADTERGIKCQLSMYKAILSRMESQQEKMSDSENWALRSPLYISLLLGFVPAGLAFMVISKFTRDRVGIVLRASLSLFFGGCIGSVYYRRNHLESIVRVFEDHGTASIALCPASEMLNPCEKEITGFSESIANTEFGRMRRACQEIRTKWTDSLNQVIEKEINEIKDKRDSVIDNKQEK